MTTMIKCDGCRRSVPATVYHACPGLRASAPPTTAGSRVTAAIDEAIAAGKIAPSRREAYFVSALNGEDVAAILARLEPAPEVVRRGWAAGPVAAAADDDDEFDRLFPPAHRALEAPDAEFAGLFPPRPGEVRAAPGAGRDDDEDYSRIRGSQLPGLRSTRG